MSKYVRPGEERDIRLAKRNIDSFERFLTLVGGEVPEGLGPTQGDQSLIYEVLDFMRNHIDDEIAAQALLHLL